VSIEHNSIRTITGTYGYMGNPCTTEPCLPGMAYIISTIDKYYFITVDGFWLSENRNWDDYTPNLEDLITITGYVYENKKDAFGKLYNTIETISLVRAKQ
jgi:hypothetical protein